MSQTLTASLVELLKAKRFEAVFTMWSAADPVAREAEPAKRVVAAALAQSGQLSVAYDLLDELASRGVVELPTLALAGRVAFDLRKYRRSVDHFERAVALDRDSIAMWKWLADAAFAAKEPERALRGAEVHALRFFADVDMAIRFASLLATAGRNDEALIAFERILARWPQHEVAGPAFAEFVMREFPLAASTLLARTAWRPVGDELSPELVRALLWMPAFHESEATATEWRDRLQSNLKTLAASADASKLVGDARARCLATTPFFAAFHDADVTPIQLAWGDFVEALVAPLRSDYPLLPRPERGCIKTVAIVSNRLTDSSAGRFFNSWIDSLHAANFTVRLYAIGASDHVTDDLERRFSLRRFPVDDVTDWRVLAKRLHGDANDAIIFPEPQGSQLITLIASIRFAHIQCAAFGNPLTTGLATMDYFFVPNDAEVADPQSVYRESVVRIAGLGTEHQSPSPSNNYERAAFGIGVDQKVIIVSQQLQKWTPTFVSAVLEILTHEPSAILLYFSVMSGVSVRAFECYLRERFLAAGLAFADRAIGIGMLSRENYLAAHRCSDLALDTFGFSGGASTLDAVSVGLPVVSLEGRFLRGRQSAAILRAAGQDCNVVSNVQAFVGRARHLLRSQKDVMPIAARSNPKLNAEQTFSSAAWFLSSLKR